jgi:Outer membrane protein beta-barrel domain
MKKAILILACFTFISSIQLMAQQREYKSQKGQLGITYSTFGQYALGYSTPVMNDTGFDSKKYYTLGIIYVYSLNKRFDLETGIEYLTSKIIITSVMPNSTQTSETLSLTNIPLTLRVKFLKYCFINGGLGLNINVSKNNSVDDQTGLGYFLGLGLKYDFKSGLSLFVNPYMSNHSLIPFATKKYHQILSDNGLRFGLTFKL